QLVPFLVGQRQGGLPVAPAPRGDGDDDAVEGSVPLGELRRPPGQPGGESIERFDVQVRVVDAPRQVIEPLRGAARGDYGRAEVERGGDHACSEAAGATEDEEGATGEVRGRLRPAGAGDGGHEDSTAFSVAADSRSICRANA